MDDIAGIAKGGWAAAAAIIAAIAYVLFKARQGRVEKDEEKRSALEEELKDARAKWAAAEFCKDVPGMNREARRINTIRRRLGLPVAILCAALAAGCASQKVRTVILSEHCRTAAPGDTVPDLPEGETRWWLCTSTGLQMMMPADADLPDLGRRK